MLKDKYAVITGVASGIGLATAQKFLKEGAIVYGIGPAEKTLTNMGERFAYLPCDVINSQEIQESCKKLETMIPHLDILITVCDTYYAGTVTDFDPAVFQTASKHMILAPMLFTKYLTALLHKAENGTILHDVPLDALMIEEDFLMSSLNTSVVNYVRQCAPKLRPIRINAVLYGLIKGHLLTPEKEAKYSDPANAALLPAHRLGTPEDVANFNAFLGSDKARYLNSAVMQIDGGLYTMNPRSMGSAI